MTENCPPVWAVLTVCEYTAQIHTKWESDLHQFTVEIFKGTFCNISYCIIDLARTHSVSDASNWNQAQLISSDYRTAVPTQDATPTGKESKRWFIFQRRDRRRSGPRPKTLWAFILYVSASLCNYTNKTLIGNGVSMLLFFFLLSLCKSNNGGLSWIYASVSNLWRSHCKWPTLLWAFMSLHRCRSAVTTPNR